MKRVLSVVMVGVVLVLSAGCGGDKAEYPSDTNTPIATKTPSAVQPMTVPPFKK